MTFKFGSGKRNDQPVGTVTRYGEPKLTIRIIGKCNFRCHSCSTFSNPDRKGIMRMADFTKAIDILVHEKFRGVVNISGGETTLHQNLPAMVSYASKRLGDTRIVVFTNGSWIGLPGWQHQLGRLYAGENVLVRFSHDRQHVEGAALAAGATTSEKSFRAFESQRFEKANEFLRACMALGAVPGKNFDFAFKGTEEEANNYMSRLGEVPIYSIRFQKNPANRPKEMGYFAIDLDESNRALVYLTLGHIGIGDHLGGIEKLPEALRLNRLALGTEFYIAGNR